MSSEHKSSHVCVLGSLNADLIAYTDTPLSTSSHVVGSDFELGIGGKGLNVAISICSTGVPAHLVGRLGNDLFGKLLRSKLAATKVHHEFVTTDPEAGTGIGHVRVNADRDYDTVVIPAANGRVDSSDVDAALATGISFGYLVSDFEIPMATALYAAKRFRAAGAKVIVNFSPPQPDAANLLPYADVVVINKSEAFSLWLDVVGGDKRVPTDLWDVMNLLRTTHGGPRDVVVTLGERGVWGMSHEGEVRRLKAHEVQTVNTVGAGDSFLAMLVSGLAKGTSLLDSLEPASAAAALACSRPESWLTESDGPRIAAKVRDGTVVIPAPSRRSS